MGFGARVYVGTYLTTLFIQGCTVLQGMLLARMLGPQGRGEFAAVQLWPTIFATIGIFGINLVLARNAGKGGDPRLLERDTVIVSIVTGILTACACFLSISYLVPERNQNLLPYIYLFIILIPLYQIKTNIAAIDQGRGEFKLLNVSRAILYPIFFLGLVCTLFFVEDRLLGALVALLVATGAAMVLRLLAVGRLYTLGPFSLSPARLFLDGIPYQFTIVFQLTSQYVDQILLLWLLRPVELAMYVVARSSASIISSLPSSLGLISLSEATRLDEYTGFAPLAQTLRRGILLVLLLAVCFAPFLQLLIPIVYGTGFSPAIPLAIYLLIGVIALGFSDIIDQALRGHGIPMSAVLPRSVGILVLVFVSCTAAPRYGAAAVAVGFSISQLIVFALFVRVILFYFKESSIKQLIPQVDDWRYIVNQLKKQFFAS